MSDYIEIGVQVIEWFKELTGFNTTEFLEYMNKNNVWNILNNKSVIEGCMWADEADILDLLGQFLTKEERLSIISRINSYEF